MKTKNKALAYYDSFFGLIPCKVIDIDDNEITKIILTANRGPYKRGELLTIKFWWVAPRSCVHIRSGQYKINPNYHWYINEDGQVEFEMITP